MMRGREPVNAVPKEEEENERDAAKKEENQQQTLNFQKRIQNWEQWKRKTEVKQ